MRKALSLLCIFTLCVCAAVIKQEYRFEAPVIRDGIAHLRGGRPSVYAFGPQVAVYPSKLLLPIGQQAKAVKVEYGNLIEMEGNYYLQPYLPTYTQKGLIVSKSKMREEMRPMVDAIYQKDELYPGVY